MLAVIGHNLPPTDAEILAEKLADNSRKDLEKMDAILSSSYPEVIQSDDEAKIIADFIDKIKSLKKTFEGTHKTEKAPYLEMGRVVDGFFKTKIETLETFQKKVAGPVNAFLTAKAEQERKLLREREEKARLEAEALLEQARLHEAENIKDTAGDLMEAALQKEQKANAIGNYAVDAKNASLAKIRTETGTVLSQKTRTVGEPENGYGAVDISAIQKYFKDESIQLAINAAIRDGVRQIPGVKIYQKSEI